jgi:Fic family protein
VQKNAKIIQRINSLQKRFLKLKEGNDALLRLLYEAEVSEQVYNSNAIENSTLTLEETDRILREINLDRFVTERELFEAKNLARVVAYIHQVAPEKALDLEMMLLLHKMLISNIRDDIAGRIREGKEWVRVGSHIAADPLRLRELIHSMFVEYQSSGQDHIVKRIARFHLRFEHIHPFVDGNGRIGRVLNNYLLIREGHVPINIKFTDRSLYYDAFKAFDQNEETKIMEQIVARSLTNSYHKRLAYLERKEIMSLNDYAKATKQAHNNLINKANRQTISAFLEKGRWVIGRECQLDKQKSDNP